MIFKVYPFFLLFLFFARLPNLLRLSFSGFDFIFIALIFVFGYSLIVAEHDESFYYTIKNCLNLAFFHQSVRLCANNRLSSTKLELPIFSLVLFSFLQILYIVAHSGLWLYPIGIVNSASSEIINDIPKFVGVDPKNIWASQIFFVFVVYSVAILYKKVNVSIVTYVIFTMYSFIQFYLASRVSQIATILLLLIIFFGLLCKRFPLKVKRASILAAVTCLLILIYFYLDSQLTRLSISNLFDFDAGHSGDGFKQRLIIYSYFYDYLGAISWIDLFFGIGVSSVSHQSNWVFSESNLHNMFLTIISDFGIFGLSIYVIYFYVFLRKYLIDVGSFYLLFLIPVLLVVLFQYQGFDLDILWFLAAYAGVSQMGYIKRMSYSL